MCAELGRRLKRVYDMCEMGYRREHPAKARSQVNVSISARQGIAGALGDIKKR